MNTLNYWLGKLNRLQLFGHGVKDIVVIIDDTEYRIAEVRELDGKVYVVAE